MKKVYLIAVVFALIAGLATYMFASNINKKTTIKDRETVNVVVAIKDIPKNTLISEDMLAEDAGYFQTRSFIKEDATPEYIKSTDDIKEQVTKVDVYAGEQLNSYKFVGTDDPDVGLSFKLAPGKKAYSFQAGSTNGVDGFIDAGDTVDIITYETDDAGNVKATVAYRGLTVIRVSSNKANNTAQEKDSKISEYSSITVEVTEKQVLKLYEIEKAGSFKLVLNSKQVDGKKADAQEEAQQGEQAETQNQNAQEEAKA